MGVPKTVLAQIAGKTLPCGLRRLVDVRGLSKSSTTKAYVTAPVSAWATATKT